MPAATGADLPSLGEGLAWSYELDLGQLLAAIGVSQLGEPGDEQAAAREAAVLDEGTARDLAGVLADQLPAGPGLAGWIAGADPRAVSEFDLPAWRRLTAGSRPGPRPGSSPPSPRWPPAPPCATIMSASMRTDGLSR